MEKCIEDETSSEAFSSAWLGRLDIRKRHVYQS